MPNGQALPLGYRFTITAVNNPPVTDPPSTQTDARAVSSRIITISTPPEVLTPNVAIYDTTPTITWTNVVGAVGHELELFNVTTNSVQLTISLPPTEDSNKNIIPAPTTFTVPDGSNLPVGEYQARVRSFRDKEMTVASDWSTVHVFLVGTAPVPLGPSHGIGATPFTKTIDARPTFTWRGSLDGESYEVWWKDLETGERLFPTTGIQTSSFQAPSDLPIGKYRVWVRARTGVSEPSAWSKPFDFQVVTPPTITPFGPSTFNTQPTISWNTQQRVDGWEIWVNDVRNNSPIRIILDNSLITNSYKFPEALANGRYRVWVRGFAKTDAGEIVTTTQWSEVFQFDVGGRPTLTLPTDTTDVTPTVSWTRVEGASAYDLYLAPAATIGKPIVRQDVAATSFTFSQLPVGDYRVWVRARAADGRLTPWSLYRESFLSITTTQQQTLVAPVVGTPTVAGSVPTFSWNAVASASRYEVYVAAAATPGTPVHRINTVTATSYSVTAGLPAGNYRVWVRAINASNQIGPWSSPINFTIASLELPAESEGRINNSVLLTSITTGDSAWSAEATSVSQAESVQPTDDVQPVAVKAASRISKAVPLPVVQDAVDLMSGDTVMTQWDDVIWQEESAAAAPVEVAAVEASSENRQASASTGWLAGLVAFTPSLFRRRRQRDE
ncbi:MAG: hypothetical protein R3C49_13970 [Planctomycetaceae bacterium]